MIITEKTTKVSKSFHGWEARTIRTEKGQTFDIFTMKRHSGNLFTTVTKVSVSAENGFMSTSFGMNDGFMSIDHGKIRVSEKVIKQAHYEALTKFDDKINEMPEAELKIEIPEVGDILFLDGYSKTKGSSENHWIVYKIEVLAHKAKFQCIEKDTLELSIKDYVKPYSKKLGIGTYFEKGFNMSKFGIDENKLANMLIEAQDVAKEKAENQRIANTQTAIKAEEKRAFLSQFIQADRRKTTNIIKAHCLKTFKIAKIQVSTEVFYGGDSMDVVYYAPEEIKELENFIKSFQGGHFNSMEDMYEDNEDQKEIILDGHILQDYKYVHVKYVESEITEKEIKTPEMALINWDTIFEETPDSDIQILDYSEKAIAVIGNTKRIKDQLKALGGRFNFRLKCGAGWIFPKAKKAEILAII